MRTPKTPGPRICGAFPRTQRRAIELHDSRVASCARDGDELRIALSAVVHVSIGEHGVAAGTVWSQDVELRIFDARVESLPEAALWITEGTIEIGGVLLDSLAMPLKLAGAVRVVLEGAEGRLLASGSRIELEERGERTFVERFP